MKYAAGRLTGLVLVAVAFASIVVLVDRLVETVLPRQR